MPPTAAKCGYSSRYPPALGPPQRRPAHVNPLFASRFGPAAAAAGPCQPAFCLPLWARRSGGRPMSSRFLPPASGPPLRSSSSAQSHPRPSSRRGLLPCNAPLAGARSRSPRVGEGATLYRGLVGLPRRPLRFVSARSRSPFLSLSGSCGSASFVSPHLAAARSTLPPCCPQSNPAAHGGSRCP